MFKLVVLSVLLAIAAASPVIYPTAYGAYGAYPPVVKAAVPVATSYANTFRVAAPYVAPTFAQAAPAPVFAAPATAPVFAAPAPAPVFAAPAPAPVFTAPAQLAIQQPFAPALLG